ncbi:2Fe-2S iron-sulfur cluster-binding protein [Pandoraea anhela]|uniref:Benzoate 1,2-dioxygenase electron transfer component n=1 Tax=Pandoraea anhela TaxID=2508295 RepID=A0A5E4WI67_9BURK|nr:2Fe-2S iron-sulfur cluster binding domain-containing protein [Pandoraea anhela]VVE23240.1 Benzoate 1,2-dioxygenase electron transfer component [Pandoraea anhela]
MLPSTDVFLHFADAERVHIDCRHDSTVFDAAKHAGVSLAHDCLNGSCGTCHGALLSGAVRYGVHEDALSLPRFVDKPVLPCQAKPASARVEIALPYSRASVFPKKKRTVRVASCRRVSESVWDIRCVSEGLRMFSFLPGQYVRVSPRGKGFTRAYSPYTVPGASEVGFLVREVQSGAMSGYLAGSCVESDVWDVEGPFGVFYQRSVQAPSLYIAGGTGLAPILSMLTSQIGLGNGHWPRKVVFGVSRAEDLFFVDELRQLGERLGNTSVIVTCVAESVNPGVRRGGVMEMLDEDDFIRLGEFGPVYLCGPPGMIRSAREAALAHGVASQNLLFEEFTAS